MKENGTGIAAVSVISLVVADRSGSEQQLEGVTHNVQIDQIDRAALQALIEEAQGIHDAAEEGYRIGQYPLNSKAKLQAAIHNAQAVADDAEATQSEIEQATERLNTALGVFLASVITSIPGDINDDGKVSIGDLALVAKAYGKTSEDEDWDQVKQFDVNGDGMIGIEDLAIIARLILNW